MNREYKVIKEIEDILKEDVLIYCGEILKKRWGFKNEHKMCQSDLHHIGELLQLKPATEKRENVTLIIQTSGGQIADAMSIIDLLKQNYTRVRVIVLTYAGSAGAFLSLCGSELYMKPKAMLSDFGPQNWAEKTDHTKKESVIATGKIVTSLYWDMVEYLKKGVMSGCEEDKIIDLVGNLGFLSIDGKSDKMHGQPIVLENLKAFAPESIKSLEEISVSDPSPEVKKDLMNKIVKLETGLIKRLRSENSPRILIFNNQNVCFQFEKVTVDRGCFQ